MGIIGYAGSKIAVADGEILVSSLLDRCEGDIVTDVLNHVNVTGDLRGLRERDGRSISQISFLVEFTKSNGGQLSFRFPKGTKVLGRRRVPIEILDKTKIQNGKLGYVYDFSWYFPPHYMPVEQLDRDCLVLTKQTQDVTLFSIFSETHDEFLLNRLKRTFEQELSYPQHLTSLSAIKNANLLSGVWCPAGIWASVCESAKLVRGTGESFMTGFNSSVGSVVVDDLVVGIGVAKPRLVEK